jgi:putative hemolysin
MANPASVYCMKRGGTLEMREEAGGTVGYCRLPDGTVIEEWAFFRANNP